MAGTLHMKKIIILLFCFLAQSCTTVGSNYRPESYYQPQGSITTDSMLSGADGLEDEKINALLYDRIKFPKLIRIAVLKMSTDDYWRYYSNEFTELNDSIARHFINKLRSSPRVYDASFLPSMLIPAERNIAVLREAAARFQADALLAYRSSCDSYQKYQFISPDETKSYCTVEAMLLDVRKGVIAKSVVSTQTFTAKKAADDTNFSETIKKTELEALSGALGEVSNEIVEFLKQVPVRTTAAFKARRK